MSADKNRAARRRLEMLLQVQRCKSPLGMLVNYSGRPRYSDGWKALVDEGLLTIHRETVGFSASAPHIRRSYLRLTPAGEALIPKMERCAQAAYCVRTVGSTTCTLCGRPL